MTASSLPAFDLSPAVRALDVPHQFAGSQRDPLFPFVMRVGLRLQAFGRCALVCAAFPSTLIGLAGHE